MGFLATTETAVTSGFTAVANAFGAGLLATFRPAFIVGFSIWITLIAYEVAFGKSEDGFTYLFTKIGKIFLIGVLALYGWPELADLLGGIKDGFVGAGTISGVLEANLIDPLAAVWVELWRWFFDVIKPLGFSKIPELLSAIIAFCFLNVAYALMSLAVGIFAAVALAMFLVANSIFILLLAIGPFFLLCLAFPFLQRFFETYIGSVITSILAMALTAMMVLFVANLFGLVGMETDIPTIANENTFFSYSKSLAAYYASRCVVALLIIYLYYKVFDLAAALGGGLNMGNNMVGGVRNIMRDSQRGGGGTGKGSTSTTNQIAQGSSGSSGSSAGAVQRAGRANSTFTGMAASTVSPAISAVGSTAMAGASNVARIASYGAGRAAGAVGRFAYNRNSQVSNRMSNVG